MKGQGTFLAPNDFTYVKVVCSCYGKQTEVEASSAETELEKHPRRAQLFVLTETR